MKGLAVAAMAGVLLSTAAVAQNYDTELAHNYYFAAEGSGTDLICKIAVGIGYLDKYSPSGATFAHLLLDLGLQNGNNPRGLVIFKVLDMAGKDYRAWPQVSATQFFMLAGRQVVAPTGSQPCGTEPKDICHLMQSPDDMMLLSYMMDIPMQERVKWLEDYKKTAKSPNLVHTSTVDGWAFGFSRSGIANSMVLLKMPQMTDADIVSKDAQEFFQCMKALGSIGGANVQGRR